MVDIVCDLLNTAMRRLYGNMVAPQEKLGPMAQAFYGRPYLNFSQLRLLSYHAGMPLSMTMRGWGHADAVTEADEIATPRTLYEKLSTMPDMLRIMGRMLTTRSRVRRQLALVDTSLAHLAAHDPETLSDVELLQVAKSDGRALDDALSTRF